mgnify:CR=1 FL=1
MSEKTLKQTYESMLREAVQELDEEEISVLSENLLYKVEKAILSGRPKDKYVYARGDSAPYAEGNMDGYNQALDEYDEWVKQCLK